jgi:hypothetical protein
MKRLLMIATALLALISASAANAVEMPKPLAKHAGSVWCEETFRSGSWTVVRMTGHVEDVGCVNPKAQPNGFAIEASGDFGWEDTSCWPIRISKAVPRGIYSLDWTIVARCEDYGGSKIRRRTETFVFSLFKESELTLYTRKGPR